MNKKAMLIAEVVILAALLIFIIENHGRGTTKSDSQNPVGQVVAEETQEEEASQQDVPETAEETPEETEGGTPADAPKIDINSWEYLLANRWNTINDYEPNLVEVDDGDGLFDERAAGALEDFLEGAREQGLTAILSSTYRSYEDQTYLYDVKVDEYGEEEARTIVAIPGTSEHQTGLAADITDDYYEYMNESLEQTETFQWMKAHCQEYGFILRFPKNKEDITGIIYEPWHFRYVGKEAAEYIMSHDLCLEEFVAMYKEIGTEESESPEAETAETTEEAVGI